MPEHEPEEHTLVEAIRLLEHRGPDDRGLYRDSGIGLGVTRLAIQDLSHRGHQPMMSADGRYVIAFNGEIYNFKELRRELQADGHGFRTDSDTEVLLEMFRRDGPECIGRFNGMFAFAILDTETRSLCVARDRLGIKPLYVFETRQGVLFASELKAFLPFVQEMGLEWELDESNLYEYMLFRYLVDNRTLVRNVRQCAPGTWLRVEETGVRETTSYYDLAAVAARFDHLQEVGDFDERDCVEMVREALSESIRLRMISDAPLGIALSGGVDSSLVVGLLRDRFSGPLKTFSVVFDVKRRSGGLIDESQFSDHVATEYDTDHHRIHFAESDFPEAWVDALWYNDEPVNLPNSLGIHLLAKVASKEVKVLLGGEGADEAFAGYDLFLREGPPSVLKHRVAQIADVTELVHFPDRELEARRDLVARSRQRGVNAEIFHTLNSYLLTILNRQDKMAMGASLEMRVPFLDHEVVETAMRIPGRMKLKDGVTKYVLKRLVTRYIPREQVYRRKVGFSVPLNKWLHEADGLGRFLSVLSEARTLQRAFIKREGVERLLRDFHERRGGFEYSVEGRIWILLNLELWIRAFLEERRPLTF